MSDKSTSKTSQKSESTSDRMLSALEKVLRSALSQGYESDDKFINRYSKYVQSINSATYSKDGKAKALAKHIVPNEDAYNKKISDYPNWYKDDLLTNLLKFLELCHEVASAPQQKKPKEKRTPPTKIELDNLMDEIFGRKNKK
jgi:ElaB/YqjD/DUF883 family membrane-anchored ribosome-binding protein